MTSPRSRPAVLTIAGSDSGGGAGIQADLNTFAALEVHGTTAITCLTAQNPKRVTAIHPCPARMVRAQLDAVFAELRPRAVKTGMLFNSAIIGVVTAARQQHPRTVWIVDPVMVATSGAPLLLPAAMRSFRERLLPVATLVTPNVAEAELLLGCRIRTPEALREAARNIYRTFGCAALVKGGHLRGLNEAVDFFYDAKTELLLRAPYIGGISTHGTGCTYSAAIAAFMARGLDLPKAVELAKSYITAAIADSRRVAGHWVLNHRPAGYFFAVP